MPRFKLSISGLVRYVSAARRRSDSKTGAATIVMRDMREDKGGRAIADRSQQKRSALSLLTYSCIEVIDGLHHPGKSRPTSGDPQKVAKFYIDNFGATMKREIPGAAASSTFTVRSSRRARSLRRQGRSVSSRPISSSGGGTAPIARLGALYDLARGPIASRARLRMAFRPRLASRPQPPSGPHHAQTAHYAFAAWKVERTSQWDRELDRITPAAFGARPTARSATRAGTPGDHARPIIDHHRPAIASEAHGVLTAGCLAVSGMPNRESPATLDFR